MKTRKTSPCLTTRVADVSGTSWLVTITDRAPRVGERGAWLHASKLDEALREELRPVLDDDGHVRPWFAKNGALRLGILYTYAPEPHECVHGRARLVTIEVEPEERAEVSA